MRQSRSRAPREARVLLSLIYAHLLQVSLLDDYRSADFLRDISDLTVGPTD